MIVSRRRSFIHGVICFALLALPLSSHATVINSLGKARHFVLHRLIYGFSRDLEAARKLNYSDLVLSHPIDKGRKMAKGVYPHDHFMNAIGSKLTLSAPAGSTFVLNVGSHLLGGAFSLSPAQVILKGGLIADGVLSNVLGSGGADIANSTVNGILLALNRSVDVSGGTVNGEIVGDCASLSDSKINNPPPVVPEANTAVVLIPFIGAILFSASRRFLRRSPAN